MTTFTEFNKHNVGQLREELKAVLEKFGVDSNLQFTFGAGTFYPESVEFKLECKVVGGKGKTDLALEQAIAMYQLKNEDRMGKFRMVGYNSKKWSKPFILEEIATGQRYVSSLENVQLRFGK